MLPTNMIKRPPVRRVAAFLFGVSCAWIHTGLLGCQANSKPEALVARVADTDLSTRARIEALDAFIGAGDTDEHWQVLARTAWVDRQPLELRAHAFNAMLERDALRLSQDTALMLPSVASRSARLVFLEAVGEHGWANCLPALIRSWQRPVRGVEDGDRMERVVVEDLTGLLADEVLLGWVCDQDGQDGQGGDGAARQSLAEQTAAWIVLARWRGYDEAKAMVEQIPAAAGSLGALLQAAGTVLEVWPTTREQVAWLALMPLERVDDLSSRRGMALRHVALAQRGWPTDQRVADGLAFIASHRPVQRDKDLSGHTPELVSIDDLSQADRAAVAMIRLAVQRPEVRAALFAQAMDDHADPNREHGGVLRFTADGSIEAHPLPSRHAVNDERYVPPQNLLFELQGALAQYHFHAQSYKNASLAGPGKADLAFAESFGCSCLVLTWIDRHTLNMDWFTQGGQVLDLGMLER